MACSGNSQQKCGGYFRNNVYQINGNKNKSNYFYFNRFKIHIFYITVRPNPCNRLPSPCNSDSTCRPSYDGAPLCFCPVGKTPDGKGGCCEALTCRHIFIYFKLVFALNKKLKN